MRRPIVVFLLCSLAFAGMAGAATPKAGKWKSTYVQLGYEIGFTVKNGKVKKFGGYVLEQCAGNSGRTQTAVYVDKAMPVKRGGKFSAREKVEENGVTVITTVKGRFTTRKKAVGTLRAESVVAGSTCDTYELDWKAKRA